MIGSTVAHYRVTAKLGEGGMGVVYRATDSKLGREVAIKVLPPAFTRDADRLARFAREAQVLASLNHPNVATIHGLEESGARALVMELVEGPTLAERLNHGPLPLDEALAVFLQIACALEYAHEKGIVHRDLKPANVKLTPAGSVKVLDFGLAKAIAADPSPATATALAHSPTITHSTTTPGMMLGTAAYMAPEQAKGQPVDERADIWAFGVVFYEALTGTRLFAGDTVPETLAHVLTREPDLALLPEGTPARIRNLLRRCLRRDPRHRLQAIGDARVVLEEVMAHPEVDTSAVGPFVPGVARARRFERLAWAVVAVAAVAAGWLLRGAPPAAPPIRSTIDLPEVISLEFAAGRGVALSPDGSLLALTAVSIEDKEQRLYLRALDALEIDPVPGTEGAGYPFWSPDGRALGFFAGGKLKRLDLPGKVVRTLCDAPAGRGGSWSAQGVIAFAPAVSGGLLQVSAGGGVPTPLTVPRQPLLSHRLPQFLPDGRRLLYTVIRGDAESRGVWLFDLETREEKRLLPVASGTQFVAPGYLAFVRDGNLMLQPFDVDRGRTTGAATSLVEKVHHAPVARASVMSNVSFSRTGRLVYQLAGRGRQRLVWIGRGGERLATAAEVSGLAGLSLSPDGRQAVLQRVDEQSRERLFLLDLERGVQGAVTAEVNMFRMTWSPDGREIAYDDLSGPGYRVQRQNLSRGEPPRTVLDDPTHDFHPTGWSPDGKTLVLTRFAPRDAQNDVVALELVGERRLRPLVAGPAVEDFGQVSPQGGWLSFLSDESGRPELYVVSFPAPGRRWPITSGVAGILKWLSENELSYVAADGRIFHVTLQMRGDRLEVGTPRRVFGDVNWLTASLVSIDEDPATGRLLVAEHIGRPGGGPLVLLSDWRAELARR